MKSDMRYVSKVPREIAEGEVLVHNFPPGWRTRGLGHGGFRAWLTTDKHYRVCKCGWAPHLPEHGTSGGVDENGMGVAIDGVFREIV